MLKVALITGGGTGIGKETALLFSTKGYAVVLAGRNKENIFSVAEIINQQGGNAFAVPTDIREKEQCSHLISQIIEKYGHLNFAFNNSGVGSEGTITEQEEEDFDYVIQTNIKGLWLSMKYQLQIMQKQKYGNIVNNLSVHSYRNIFSGTSAYTASKFGARALTHAAAIENSIFHIRVNGVAPGPIDTSMYRNSIVNIGSENSWLDKIPMKRVGTTNEVAQAVLWLASDKSSYVNGHIIAIDGGYLAA